MVDEDTCPAGHINPRKMCRCHSMSEEPCWYCDWWDEHGYCDPIEDEEEDDDD